MVFSSKLVMRSIARRTASALYPASQRVLLSRRGILISADTFSRSEQGLKRKDLLRGVLLGEGKKVRWLSTAVDGPNVSEATPDNAVQQPDFFGEPVTIVNSRGDGEERINASAAMEALDDFVIAAVTKGKTCKGGGDEEGLATQAAHSAAIAWAQVLKHAFLCHSNKSSASCPMLACAAVGPLLAQAGVKYVAFVDRLLAQTQDPVHMLDMAREAASLKDHPHLSPRERWHLEALGCLLYHDYRGALASLLKLLQHCPGDALALSLAMDIASTLGDRRAALRAAGSVAAYWHERGGRGLRRSISGYSIGSSWIALGFAAGGRFGEAERLAERALQQDPAGSGGVATLALAHAYDAEGRTSEGISMLAGYDGVQHYEACGLLFFDSRLGGYGARFSLDREGTRGGKVALRMYDTSFARVLQYSGFAERQPWLSPARSAPKGRGERMAERVQKGTNSIFQQLFGSDDALNNVEKKKEESRDNENPDSNDPAVASVEDVLTWLPPTPQLLTDATLLLLRLTINGTVSANDARWSNLRNAWVEMVDIYAAKVDNEELESQSLVFLPQANIASSLLVDKRETIGSDETEGLLNIGAGMNLMGKLMELGNLSGQNDSEPDEDTRRQWQQVVQLLSHALNEPVLSEFEGWEMDMRPILEHAICHAACLAQDDDSLCLARSLCSKGVCLRPNSPEEWWRYSVVLDQLGDTVAAEDARSASVSLGSGEGVTL